MALDNPLSRHQQHERLKKRPKKIIGTVVINRVSLSRQFLIKFHQDYQMSKLLHMTYFVNRPQRREDGVKIQNGPHGLWMTPKQPGIA